MFHTSLPFLYDLIYSYKDYQQQTSDIQARLQHLHHKNGTLLEMACGTGQYISHFSDFDCCGVDLCSESLMYASFRNPKFQFLTHNMLELSANNNPFRHDNFDVILALFGAIGYIKPKNLKRCLAKWLSLLSPNGILIVEPWHFFPEEGSYQQRYQSDHLEIVRNATVRLIDKKTMMRFVYQLTHHNGKTEALESEEILYSHSATTLEQILSQLGATIVEMAPSDFQENGQWFVSLVQN